MADRNILQMDKAEPEDKDLPGDFKECSAYADMDSDVLLPAFDVYQISDEIQELIILFE